MLVIKSQSEIAETVYKRDVEHGVREEVLQPCLEQVEPEVLREFSARDDHQSEAPFTGESGMSYCWCVLRNTWSGPQSVPPAYSFTAF